MLRAFNGECDTAVPKVRYNNVEALTQRLVSARDKLNALGSVKQCWVTDEYLVLKPHRVHACGRGR